MWGEKKNGIEWQKSSLTEEKCRREFIKTVRLNQSVYEIDGSQLSKCIENTLCALRSFTQQNLLNRRKSHKSFRLASNLDWKENEMIFVSLRSPWLTDGNE